MPVIKIIIIGILFCVDSVYVLIALFLVQWVLDPNSRQNCVVSKLSLKMFRVKCLLSRIDARNAALLTDTFEGERAPCMKVFLWQLPCCVTVVFTPLVHTWNNSLSNRKKDKQTALNSKQVYIYLSICICSNGITNSHSWAQLTNNVASANR